MWPFVTRFSHGIYKKTLKFQPQKTSYLKYIYFFHFRRRIKSKHTTKRIKRHPHQQLQRCPSRRAKENRLPQLPLRPRPIAPHLPLPSSPQRKRTVIVRSKYPSRTEKTTRVKRAAAKAAAANQAAVKRIRIEVRKTGRGTRRRNEMRSARWKGRNAVRKSVLRKRRKRSHKNLESTRIKLKIRYVSFDVIKSKVHRPYDKYARVLRLDSLSHFNLCTSGDLRAFCSFVYPF